MAHRYAIAKAHVLDALEDVIHELFGAGRKAVRRHRDRFEVLNPWRGGATADQMSVWRGTGAWKDFVSGDKGDALQLVAFGLTGETGREAVAKAVDWIEDRFGIKSMSPAERDALAAAAKAKRAEREKAEAEDRQQRRDKARKFFFSCEPEIRGTLAEVYLLARGVDLDQVPSRTGALRFKAECTYWMAPATPGGKPKFPAMIALMVDTRGKPQACHYTFLEPDGSRKLDTAGRGYLDAEGKPTSSKLMFPESAGAFIPLTYGPHGLKISAAAAAGVSELWGWTEGIEDGLSVAIAEPRLRVFAAGSLSGLMHIPDHKAKRGDLLFQDNDWNKPEAQALFGRAVARLRRMGKPVTALAMPAAWGKDVNDALNFTGEGKGT